MQRLMPTDDFMARIMEGRALADAGHYEAAEARFRALLETSREGHAGNHCTALASLIPTYGRAGRYLEVHLIARQLERLGEGLGEGGHYYVAFARGAICGALARLSRQEALGHALVDLRQALDAHGSPLPGLEMEYRSAAGSWALERQELALAREHLSAYRAELEAAPELPPLFRRALWMAEARLAHHEGQHELAARLLARVEASGMTPAFHRMQEMPLRIAVEAGCGRMSAARALADEALEILANAADEAFLVSDRIHQGNALAAQLEGIGATDLMGPVFDLVAAAIMIRLQQVATCMRALPELGMSDPSSTAALGGFRKAFLLEQRGLLRRVAAWLEAQGDPQVSALLDGSASHGLIAVCAWCECVRSGERIWLPIGHFVPREGTLRLTHGICPTCARQWHAEAS